MSKRGIAVNDAYVKRDAAGARWAVGTAAVEQVFACHDGQFRLVHYRNKLAVPVAEYVDAQTSSPFFELAAAPFLERHVFENLWSAPFLRRETIRAVEPLTLQVEKDDVLAFRADRKDDTKASLGWNIALDYEGAAQDYVSPPLRAEAFYTLDKSGALEKLAGAVGAIPGRVVFDLGARRNLMRLWQAPRAGTICVGGSLVSGSHGDLDVSIQRVKKVERASAPARPSHWTVEKDECREVAAGGCPALQLDLTLQDKSLQVHLHIMAYPGTSIIRHWLEIENTGTEDCRIESPAPFFMRVRTARSRTWVNSWMTGADSSPTQGLMRRAELGRDYHNSITSDRCRKYVPWMAFERGAGNDGLFVSSESLCDWNMTVARSGKYPALLAVSLLAYAGRTLQPGERIEMPPITTGVFAGGLDGMSMRIYDWQYQYLWDYTNPDYYARTHYAVPWVFCMGNLQEQYAYRLAGLDMAGADYIREAGIDMLWDDAGWAKHPTFPVPDNYGSVFHHNYDGPDFSLTQRFLAKMGAKWLAWFCGRPSAGVMDAKIAAWGPFQWRTDGVGAFAPESETAFRANIQGFLDRNPKASFHTCDGGSVYAHTFGIQRVADLNYLSDFGRGDEMNYNFSHLDTPDKWMDLIDAIQTKLQYKPERSRQMLCLVPGWAFASNADDRELLRRQVMELYHYLLREGVAGRWSYVFHPVVKGDKESYYLQRANHARTKSLIILKHLATREIVIYPRGLIPGHDYTVNLDSETETVVRTGADLMAHGIQIPRQQPGELIYLGLPDRPGATRDRTPSEAVGRIFKRFELNIGHSGVGLYWTAAAAGRWVSYYEVRRDGCLLGRTAIGCYFFDHAEGWDPHATYSVRAIGGNDVPGPWQDAERIAGEPLAYHGLGGHSAKQGRDGWGAETTTDGRQFAPMAFVPPVKNPAADVDGGTPNQPGGVEGYWESAAGARLGRGWQKAAQDVCCVRTWTAPCAGRVRVLGRAMKECFRRDAGSPGLAVEIRHGAERVWQAEVARGTLDGATHDLRLEVRAGDVLRFVLGKGGDPDNDIISWMPKIVYEGASGVAPGASVVRISCGSAADAVDGLGHIWTRDVFYQGGSAVRSGETAERGQSRREGGLFSYQIPVQPGLYSVRLKFAETDTRWYYRRPMDVSINEQRVLASFDVCHATRGASTCCDKAFHHIVPDAAGRINLQFAGVASPIQASCQALVSAIEILPELRPAVRINCGAASGFVDWNTDEWVADCHARGGATLASKADVKLATPTIWDQGLYRTARAGREIMYRIPLPAGLYTVQLKFAELWLDTPGKRPMDIFVNSRVIQKNWDPALAAGEPGMAAGIRVEDITPDKDGHIVVQVAAAGSEDAILQAIEIE